MDAIISHGCFLRECSVQHSIVGVRSRLEYGAELKVSFPLAQVCVNSFLCPGVSTDFFGYGKKKKNIFQDTMMMGADYYQTEEEIASLLADGKVPVGVGANTKIW